MLYPLSDAVLIQWDEALRLLRFQWAGGSAQSASKSEPIPEPASIRSAFTRGRDLVVSQQARRALVDFTGLPTITFRDELWLARNWLPVVLGQALEQTALVFSGRGVLHNHLAEEVPQWLGRRQARLQLQFFDDAPSALHWLSGGDAEAVRRLQAEWATARLPT